MERIVVERFDEQFGGRFVEQFSEVIRNPKVFWAARSVRKSDLRKDRLKSGTINLRTKRLNSALQSNKNRVTIRV